MRYVTLKVMVRTVKKCILRIKVKPPVGFELTTFTVLLSVTFPKPKIMVKIAKIMKKLKYFSIQ